MKNTSETRIPVTVLTGFLGSGKTTVLRHLGQIGALDRTLILVNEFGEVGLDHELLTPIDDDTMVAVNSGCICCSIRADLVQTLGDAPWRFARNGQRWFDRVIIETTGIADPAPILQTIIGEQAESQSYVLSSVLTAVDAVNRLDSLHAHFEAVKQVAVADRILLTKTDLIDTSPDALLAKLNALAPSAPTSTVVGGEASADWFFNVGKYEVAGKGVDVPTWLEGERLAVAEQAPHDHSGHVHDRNRHQRIESSCLIFEEPVDPGLFEACLEMLMQFRGADLLRVKGIINVSGMDRPMVIHGVQHVFHPPEVLERWPSDDHRTKLVVIARDLDHGELQASFLALGLHAT